MWLFGHSRGREGLCGVTIMIKRKILKTEEDVRVETNTEGRWVIVTVEGVLDEELVVCGMRQRWRRRGKVGGDNGRKNEKEERI